MYPLSRAVAANPSDSDRVGCVVRYANPFLLRMVVWEHALTKRAGGRFAPWWLNSNGALTSHRLPPRPVPRATYDVLHPDAKPLFRHVTEGMEDEMVRSQTRHF